MDKYVLLRRSFRWVTTWLCGPRNNTGSAMAGIQCGLITINGTLLSYRLEDLGTRQQPVD